MPQPVRLRWRLALWAGAALLCSRPLAAAPPAVSHLFPAGLQRGQTVTVTAAGSWDAWPLQAWIDRPGLTVAPGAEKGQLQVTAAGDAPSGVYWLRMYDAAGCSAPRPLVVDSLAEVNEVEPNNGHKAPQVLESSSVVVNGRLSGGGDVDTFAVKLTAGQTLVASVEANQTLGSPLDAVAQVLSAGGFVLERNDDQRGMDPLLAFTAPADGVYLARVFGFPAAGDTNVNLAGGDALIYRLTLTTGGFADAAWPLAAPAGAESTVQLTGWNIAAPLGAVVARPAADATRVDAFDPQIAGVISLRVAPQPSLVEIEPNGPDAPQAIALPASLTGRLETPRDKDVFRFQAPAGQALVFGVESRGLGYPVDPVLEVSGADGKVLARGDDTGANADTELAFTPPAEGEYRLIVSDLYGAYGPRHVYRVSAAPAQADFDLTLEGLTFTVAAGQTLEIPVTIERRHGFAEDIDVGVAGLPAHVTAAPVKSLAADATGKSVKLVLTAGAEVWSGPIRIEGRSTGDRKLVRSATSALTAPVVRLADLWLTVTVAAK